MKALGLAGEPAAWDWEYLSARVAGFGRYRLDLLPPRHRAAAAELAGRYGLNLVAIAPGIHELRPQESGARRGAAVGPRGIRRAL